MIISHQAATEEMEIELTRTILKYIIYVFFFIN